jgi:hypothetical protein
VPVKGHAKGIAFAGTAIRYYVSAHVSSLHRELIWVGLFKFGVLPRLIAQALHPIALNLRTVPAIHIAAASLGWVMTTRFTSIPVYVAYDVHL